MANITHAQTMHSLSFNIRYPSPHDGEDIWDNRKDAVAKLIHYYAPDIFGVQEATWMQMEFLNENLKAYAYIGVGRDDGDKGGEFSAIFYKTAQWKVLKNGTFWLSETPGEVSKGWDAALPRVCTYGLFENQTTKNKVWVFNTHFDHMGNKAREKSAEVILSKIKELNTENLPLL